MIYDNPGLLAGGVLMTWGGVFHVYSWIVRGIERSFEVLAEE